MKFNQEMHEPLEKISSWRNPNLVGMVYEVNELHNSHTNNRILKDDILLCLEHTGDCYYTWALLSEAHGNNTNRYFSIEKIYSGYSIKGKLLIPFNNALTDKYMKEMLINHIKNPNSSYLCIEKTDEEIEKIKNKPCLCCGRSG